MGLVQVCSFKLYTCLLQVFVSIFSTLLSSSFFNGALGEMKDLDN